MKKAVKLKSILVKSLIVIGLISVPITSYYSFNQDIPNTILYAVLALSIVGNFYSPLHVNCFNELDLTFDVKNSTFQPIYVTKQGGITESINASFNLNKKNSNKVDKIEFYVLKYSGLLNHTIYDISAQKIGKDAVKLVFQMRFLAFKKQESITISELCSDVQERFDFSKTKSLTIYTEANYGIFHRFRIWLTEFICDIINPKLNQGGSICNINCIHSGD